MVDITDEIFASRLSILRDLFADSISAPTAAKQLAEATLLDETTLEDSLGRLWSLVLSLACEKPEQHDKLVDVLVDLSELPNPGTEQGSGPLTIHEMELFIPVIDLHAQSLNPRSRGRNPCFQRFSLRPTFRR